MDNVLSLLWNNLIRDTQTSNIINIYIAFMMKIYIKKLPLKLIFQM